MRFFPSAPGSGTPTDRRNLPAWLHPQWLVTLLVVLLAGYGLVAPLANADDEDDLKRKQKQVQGQIDQAQDDLHEASRAVSRAAGRLDSARTELRSARAQLTRVRGQLTDARIEAKQLRRQLTAAQNRLARAAAQLRVARRNVAVQRLEAHDSVLDIATGGDPKLAVLSSYVSSGSVEEILINQTAGDLVVLEENQLLEGLEEAEAALEEHKDEVAAARNAVADKEAAAQRNLTRTRSLVTQARRTKVRVDSLVVRAERARRAAVRARDDDRAALERLKDREAAIKREILRLANQNPGRDYRGDTGGLLHVPTNGPVTSPYGYRTHPIYGYYSLHDGTDFGASCGSALWAGERGTVINTYWDEVYGNRLYLSIGRVNGANITLVYNHMSGYAASEGQTVGRGDVVGYVGSTGWSTGCHLHFTVLRNGEPVDPMNYL